MPNSSLHSAIKALNMKEAIMLRSLALGASALVIAPFAASAQEAVAPEAAADAIAISIIYFKFIVSSFFSS